MTGAGFPEGRAAQALLAAPALLYGTVMALRNRLYDAGYLTTERLPCAVISIGNLTVGGTGKTPIVSHLAGALREAGYRVGVLSRGYRRRGGAAPLLVSDGRALLADADLSGDEPYLIARDNPAVAVAVGADRARAARLLFAAAPPEAILLDDAFQHRRIARDTDLLLIDARRPWGNGRMLPAGPLREPVSAVSRADAVVVTRSQGRLPEAVASILERHNPRATIFHVRIGPRAFVRTEEESVACSALRGFAAYAFSGIACPERFEDDLAAVGVRVVASRRFRDHHPYRPRDLEELAREARRSGAEVLVTTEKDLVRITAWPPGAPPVYALALGVTFDPGPDLAAWLLDRLQALGRQGRLRAAR